jgi:hypothetical protein
VPPIGGTVVSLAGAAVVAVAAAGTMLRPREAKAATVEGSGTPGVHGVGTAKGAGYYGAYGENNSSGGYGVSGLGDTGVFGVSSANGSSGIYGKHSSSTAGHGILGEGKGTEYAGVKGTNATGAGVKGESANTGYEGVYGKHTGSAGYGVVGDGTGNGAGVFGRNFSGAGVESRDSRYGGKFDGSRAPLLLVPKGSVGRPTSGAHTKGEIYLDSAASVFVCTKSGTPGTWRKVTTTAT